MNENFVKEEHILYSKETTQTNLTQVQTVITNNVAGYISSQHQSRLRCPGVPRFPTMSFITTPKFS